MPPHHHVVAACADCVVAIGNHAAIFLAMVWHVRRRQAGFTVPPSPTADTDVPAPEQGAPNPDVVNATTAATAYQETGTNLYTLCRSL